MDTEQLTPQSGDFFLVTSDRFAAKLVRFFMWEKNVWKLMYRYLFDRKKLMSEFPYYYHAGLIESPTSILEQQGKFQCKEKPDMDWGSSYVIIRHNKISDTQRALMIALARTRLGDRYGVVEVLGNFLTWLTSMVWFRRHLDTKNASKCITKVCEFYWHVVGEQFGVKNVNDSTTQTVWNYVKNNPNKFTIVKRVDK